MVNMVNKIIEGDCLEGIRGLGDRSVNCCVTSPPYFGLRDYGVCGQIGLEETPEIYVQKLAEVFCEVRRVLKDDGTLWLNLGDSYCGGGQGSGGNNAKQKTNKGSLKPPFRIPEGMKAKDLIGIPWMVAFALRSAGWYLRQDIIWHKPNPMPESVTDRCTKAHEYIFLMSKSARYYYDAEAIEEDAKYSNIVGMDGSGFKPPKNFGGKHSVSDILPDRKDVAGMDNGKRNKRSVWTVTTKPFKEAHFATFPEDLIVDCIKAGCPEGGVVLDPFMGAGTTALVARKLNRNFIGFELNKEYIEIANHRLQKELGLFC